MSYFIKANFGRLTEIDGEELVMGENAFKSFSLLQKTIGLSEGDDVILLDSRNTFDSTDYEAGVNFYSGKYVDYSDTYKAVGTVIVKNESNSANFFNFKDIQITDSSIFQAIGGEMVETERENPNGTGRWVDEFKTSGKAVITTSQVESDIVGYTNVTVKDSTVSQLTAINNDDVAYAGYYKDEESSTFIYNYDKETVSGALTFIKAKKTVGTVTASGATTNIMGIYGYDRITASLGATIDSITGCGKYDYKLVHNFRTARTGITVTENITDNIVASGTLTATDSTIENSVEGIKNVTLTNTGAGSLSSTEEIKTSIKNTYTFNGTEELFEYVGESGFNFEEATPDKHEETTTVKSTGVLTVKLDRKATDNINVDNILNYSRVTISGYKDLGVDVLGSITTNCITEKETEDNLKETGSWLDEYKADGTINLKDNVVVGGDIIGFTTVNLKNSDTEGSINAYAWESTEDVEIAGWGYYKNLNSIDAYGNVKMEEDAKAVGAVTLDGSSIDQDINGYARVTLKNDSYVGGSITSFENCKTTSTYNARTEQETYRVVYSATNSLTADNAFIGGSIDYFSTVRLTNTDVGGNITGFTNYSNHIMPVATGSFTFSINARTAHNTIYNIGSVESEESYAVSRFKNVTISGIADFRKGNFICASVNGGIEGEGTLTLKNNVWVHWDIDGFKTVNITTCQIDGDIYTELAKSSITVTDTNISGSIMGYDNVRITNGNVFSDIDGAINVTLTAADVEGDIYANKLTVSKGCDVRSFFGTAEKGSTLTVNGGAIMEIESLNFGDQGKFVVNGTVILTQSCDFNEIGLSSMTGSGVIAADRDVYDNTTLLAGSRVKFINLGNTAEDFHGQVLENSDNNERRAVEADWDMTDEYNIYELDGWLGGAGCAILDTQDWMKFTAMGNGTVEFSGLEDGVDVLIVNGITLDSFEFEISAGTNYKVGIIRNADDSVNYVATMNLA